MLHSKQKSKYGKMLSISLMLLLIGALILFFAPTKVFARQIDVPDYLRITTQSATYENGDTIFLDQGETLSITLGKPNKEIETDAGGNALPFINQDDIGQYALSNLATTFSMKMNNQSISNPSLESASFLSIGFYSFQPTTTDITGVLVPSGAAKNFMFLELIIDLGNSLFQPGEYTFSFTNYLEYSQNNFLVSDDASFSFTVYIFNTTDYFSSNSASSQNITFENVEAVTPNTSRYRNYYYFNYSNLYTTEGHTQNYLPVLSFDASKFELAISKDVSGNKSAAEISKFNASLVTLSENTIQEFVFAKFDTTSNTITITFNDIGEYVLNFKFIYERFNSEKIELSSEEITACNEKSNVLYVFGGQIYHSGQALPDTEFKLLTSDKLKTEASYSADITYLLDAINHTKLIKSDDSQTFESDDATIKSLINAKKVLPVSTNQPAVIFSTNTSIDLNLTKFYRANLENNLWQFEAAQTYKDTPFTESGTYLVKLVYDFNNYYSGTSLSLTTKFVQYFFFSIDNSTPSAKVFDNLGNTLNSNCFTKNACNVCLDSVSPFNSSVRLEVHSKTFAQTAYSLNQFTNGNILPQTLSFNAEGNYMVKLLYGKNFNKSQTLYFTIDKTEISGLNILPVVKNNYTGGFEKQDAAISFFTNQAVVVEWQEKQSGAATKAYYKYVPFMEDETLINSRLESTVSGIITSYKLNLDVTKNYDKATYLNTLNTVSASSVFTNQGLYIIYITDEAGHDKLISFCIDKSPLQVLQVDKISGAEKLVSSFDLVDSDQYLNWGSYKLISLGIDAEQVANIEDAWVKTAIETLYNPLSEQFADNIHSLSSKLYFSPQISKVYAQQTGTSLKLITDNINGYTEINIMAKTSSGMEYANEITYGFYLIDESNMHFNKFSQMQNATYSDQDCILFVENANKSFQITTSTDASNANIMINETQSIKDVSLITPSSTSLLQAGFADSKANQSSSTNLRSKYYFATGQNSQGNISILSYRIKLDIKESLFVSKITMYFYPFVVDATTGTSALNKTATKTIIYDKENQINSLTALSGTDNDGYFAFNINVDYDNITGTYQTVAGKYIIVREYNDVNHVNEHDFYLRESVFIVDRADIISSPQSFESTAKSPVGSGVYINILNGSPDAVQFTNIYSAKNNPSTYILQTNKLPVVVFVPTMKYGLQNTLIDFVTDKTLAYYLQIENDMLIRYTLANGQDTITEKSALSLIYFGDLVVTDMFDKNPSVYKSTDFDLSVTITTSSGQQIATNLNGLNYFLSNEIMASGIYTVTITQNVFNGKNFPNVYSTFGFSFQIISTLPDFAFTSIDDTLNAIMFDSDAMGVTYTNESGKIKVMWTDPQNVNYYAKVDISQDVNGFTPIYYYLTSTQGSQISQTMRVKGSEIFTDLSSPRTHYFYIDLSSVSNDIIVNVYMQNVRGTVSAENQSLLNSLTSTSKKLYIDRTAPELNLNALISKTNFEGIDFGLYSRKFVNFDGTDATNGQELYSIPLSTGALAKYAFAVENTNQNPLMNMFVSKPAIENFYTEGYYYHIRQIHSLAEYSLPSLASLITTAKTNSNQSVQSFIYNSYYEITEIDLAGNAAIYLIFVVDNDNKVVVEFNREQTDKQQPNQIMFNQVLQQQDIYAKTFLNITSLDLHNYEFMHFSLDNEIYFMSSALNHNQAYKFSTLTSITGTAEIISIPTLMSFSPNSHHTLKLRDTITNTTYTFDLYITNASLSYNLISNGEGITISNPTNAAKQFLQEMEILSYDNGLDRYISIYHTTSPFTSNNFVSVSSSSNICTFTIIEPQLAYSYIFYDNYGNKYVEHHTVGSFVLPENQKVKNHLDTMLITETIEGEVSTNSWFVGKSNIIYSYSSKDYFAYIKIYVLEIVDGQAIWTKQTDSLNNEYGISLSDKTNYNIMYNGAVLCSISISPIHETVKQVVLYAPTKNLFDAEFTGGVYKFEITLIDQHDSLSGNNHIDRVLINNLTPIVDLKDKNNISVSTEDAMYSEQLTIIVPTLPSILTANNQVNAFMFGFDNQLVFEETSSPLISGLVVEDAGNYEVRTFIKINANLYLVATKPFVISASATEFYQVLVRDGQTGLFVTALPTGNSFTHNDISYFNHFIVNDEFNLFLNKNQYMEIVSTNTLQSHECTSYIYEISNRAYHQTHNVSPYTTTIVVSYIPKTTAILTSNKFVYETNDATQTSLTETNAFITITQNDADVESITVKFNGYYAIPENIITAKIEDGTSVRYASSKKEVTSFIISASGNYTISFSDIAGNDHMFSGAQGIDQTYYYQLRFIKGVPYLINGNTPINSAIFNDRVSITLPNTLNSIYELGGKPSIVVYRNDALIEVKPQNGEYILDESGYYKVFFNARVANKELRQESYEFLILSSKEYRTIFEYSEYSDYEISKILKNGQDVTQTLKNNFNVTENAALKTLAISLYDEKTGQGNYTITINTNSGKFITQKESTVPENFTFSFIIKQIGVLPIDVSIKEGASTTNAIKIKFNALDLYQEVGESRIVFANNTLKINEEYLSSLNGNNYIELEITENGTHFVQIYGSGDNLIYSYKVIKTEPLNTVSILLIVIAVLATAAVTVTVVLLRRRMKIK